VDRESNEDSRELLPSELRKAPQSYSEPSSDSPKKEKTTTKVKKVFQLPLGFQLNHVGFVNE